MDAPSPVIAETQAEDINKISKLGVCEVCTVHDAKYTCPRCELKTCCLRCSSIHKRELDCNGTRDRTKFIRLDKFSNLDMSSDYHLLEEIGRTIEGYKKDPKRKFTQDRIMLPTHLTRLQSFVHRQKITLKYLPQQFERHRNNTTRLQYQENTVYWHLEWVFVNLDFARIAEPLVPETDVLADVFNKRLLNAEHFETLQRYRTVGLAGCRYFLKAEEKCGNKFYELDINRSVLQNLYGKVIIEYPIIHVVFNDFADSIDVIAEDKIDAQLLKTDDNLIALSEKPDDKLFMNKLIKTDPDDIHTSLRNLLFIDDDEI